MPQPDPYYVSSSRPVNRRTTARQAPRIESVHPVVHERLAAKWARSKLGQPLAEQLRLSRPPSAPRRLSPWFIVGAVMTTASAVALLLAWIQHSWLLAVAGLPALAGGMGLMAWMARPGRAASPGDAQAAALFDHASVAAFDRALDTLAPEVPEAVATQLIAIKQQLARIAQQAASTSTDEHFTLDDRLYLTELVRRYLPDSLQSYLRVPGAQRTAQVLEQGETAVSLLLDQLKLLQDELDKREVGLAISQAGELVRQQRFLESKITP